MKEDRKAVLIQELEWARIELDRHVRTVGEDLNVASRFRQAVVHRTTAWLGGAALAGWVLSKLTRRKKKTAAALPASRVTESRGAQAGRAGLLLAALHTLFTVFKPAIAAFATRKLSQLAARDDFASDRPKRRLR